MIWRLSKTSEIFIKICQDGTQMLNPEALAKISDISDMGAFDA